MRVLIVNDDGIGSLGLRTLEQALLPGNEVWVVAPETEKSGGSHSITLRDTVRLRAAGERRFSCRGTPADCVLVAVLGIVAGPIDIVLSGINHGPNLGTDILYSGTAAGARQGALMGIPSVALSVNAYVPPFDFEGPARFVGRNLDVFRQLWTDDHFLNINFPNSGCCSASPLITFPSRRIYRDRLETYTAHTGDIFCFLTGEYPQAHEEEGSDCQVVTAGNISISPVHAHPRNWASIEASYREARFR
jgi:5'-nucleotidase